MTILRKSMALLGSVTFLALVLAALAPRAARGVAAALVQITNTPANPVPTEDHARHAVVLDAFTNNAFGGFAITFTNLDGSAFSIPAGKRLVIEQISGLLYLKAGSSVFGADLTGSVMGRQYDAFLTTPALTYVGSGDILSEFRFSQSIRFYTDMTPLISFGISSSSAGSFDVTASGYLVDCTGACE